MAATNEDLERLQRRLESKINSVSVDHVNMAQAIGSYGERFTGIEARIDAIDLRLDALSADMDRRFDNITADMDRRFNYVDQRFSDVRADIARLDGRIDRIDSKLDARFNIQTALTTALGVLILFGDPIREMLGF